jgi:hypothetical protein
MSPSHVEFLQQIKDIQAKYPELNRHDMDNYRCKYYGEILDLYYAYTAALERENRKLRESHHVITNKKIIDGIKNNTKPKNEVKLVEPKLPEYER